MTNRCCGIVCSFLLLISVASVEAAVIVLEDRFNDSGRTNGIDLLDANWIRSNSAGLSAANVLNTSDAVVNGNNSLVLTSSTQTFYTIFGEFPTQTLGLPGSGSEQIVLAFDYKFNSLPTTGSTTGFRFGLGNNGGTTQASDGNTSVADDRGYFSSAALNATAALAFTRDAGTAGTMLGGADGTPLTSTGTTININSLTPMSAQLIITRTGATSIDVESRYYDNLGGTGTLVASQLSSSTVPSASFFDFNEVGIGMGGVSGFNYAIDNVSVTVIPEPSTWALLSAAASVACLLLRRKFGRGDA